MKKQYEKQLANLIYESKTLEYDELLTFLVSDNFEEKHFALTFINKLKNQEDFSLFLHNLTNQDTKIRELSSFRINDFVTEDKSLMWFLDDFSETVLNAINDVNPQVCRNICTLLRFSEKKEFFMQKILEKIDVLLKNTEKIKFKSHKINKEIFNLYWNLFAIENLLQKELSDNNNLHRTLELCQNYKDYTIREKVACIVKKMLDLGTKDILPIVENLKTDENFYVRKAL